MNEWKDKNLDTNLKEQLENMSEEELHEAFYTNLKFGTGGMRGIIGPGTNRMNIYTLRKANNGYGNYLIKNFKKPSVIIAYDSRHMSHEFAVDSANVLATMGIKVYLFDRITPTPVLSFAIRHIQASGGIVITASHNPSQYNGYKVYDNDGCQLLPDAVNKVIKEINEGLDVFDMQLGNFDEYVSTGKITKLHIKNI